MASGVDDRVVAMKFDNNTFDSKVAGTISILDKLKNSLDFKSSSKGLEDLSNSTKGFSLDGVGVAVDKSRAAIQNLSKSASDINLEGISKAVDNISSKFSAMGAVAFTAISNITNRVVDLGIQIGKSFAIEPLTQGFNEYETNLNAIQTVLANTSSKGTTLEDVNEALKQLNIYSDKTIYNFGQMAKNVGTFTAAGVDLETSVNSIKGISNLAALSGSNAEQASTAMYQLSQALSTGTLRLIDWNSVVNAGMGGEVFQKALFETGKSLGTIKNANLGTTFEEWTKANGSFRDSLESDWLTSKVLTNTLQGFTGDLNEEQLRSLGYTQEQAKEFMKLAKLASDSATVVKTWSQLLGTVKESIGSGWSESFKLIFGDFEEAKVLFTGLNNIIGGFVGRISDGRNSTIQFWKDNGGREAIIQSLRNVMWSLALVIGTITKAWRNAFPKKTGENITRFSKFIERLTHALIPSLETMEKVGRILTGVFSIFALGWSVVKIVARAFMSLLKVFGLFSGVAGGGAGGVLEILAKIGDAITWLKTLLVDNNFLGNFFDKLAGPILEFVKKIDIGKLFQPFIDGFNKVKDFIDERFDIDLSGFTKFFTDGFDKIKELFSNLKDLNFEAVGKTITDGFNRVKEVVIEKFNEIRKALGLEHAYLNFDKLGKDIKNGLQKIHDLFFAIDFDEVVRGLGNTFDKIEAAFEKIKKAIVKLFGGGEKSEFENAANSLSTPTSALEEITGRLTKRWESLVEVGKKVIDFFKLLGEKIKTGINESFGSIGGLFDSLKEAFKTGNFQPILDALNVGLFGGILLLIKKFLDGGVGKLLVGDLFDKIGRSFDALTGHLKAMTVSIKAEALFTIAKSIALLAASLLVLSLIDSDDLARALGAMAVGFGALVITMKELDKLSNGPGDAAHLAILSLGLVALSAAILVLSFAVKKLGEMDTDSLIKGLAAVAVLLAAVSLSVKAMQSGKDMKDADMIKVGLGMYFMARGIASLAKAVRIFGEMDIKQLAQGLVAVAVSMGILVLTMKFLPEDLPLKGASLLGLALGLIVLSKAVEAFGSMEINKLVQGLEAVAVVLGLLALAFRVMPNKTEMAAVGANLLIAAIAIFVLQRSVANFGDMDFDKMKNGLIGMGAALLLLAIACNAMNGAMIGAAAIGVAAVSLTIMAKALELFDKIGLGSVLTALLGVAAVLLVLGVGGALLSLVAPAITAAGVALLLLGAGMLAAGLGAALFGAGLYLIGTAMREFKTEFTDSIGKVISLIPNFVKELANGLLEMAKVFLSGLPDLIGKFGEIFGKILDLLETYAPRIVEFVVKLITTLVKAIGDNSETLVKAGFDLLMALLRGLQEHGEEITILVTQIITGFLDGLAKNIKPLIEAGGNLILNFLAGLKEKLPLIIAAGGQLIIDFLVELEKKTAGITEAVGKLLETAIKGVAEKIKPITEAMGTLITNAISGVATAAGPITEALGKLLANVITEAAKAVGPISEALTKLLVNTMTEAAKAIGPISEAVTKLLVNTITEAGKAIGPVSEALTKLFVTTIEEMIKAIGPVSEALTKLFASGITELAKAVGPISEATTTLFVNILTELAKAVGPIIDAMSAVFVNIMTELSKKVGPISDAASTLLVNSIDALAKKIQPIQDALGNLLVNALIGIAGNVIKLQDALVTIMINVFKGAASNANRVVHDVTDMFISFIQAVSGNTQRLIDAGFGVIVDFMNGLADTIRRRSGELENAGKNLAGAIVDGLTHGLASRAEEARKAALGFMGPVAGALFGVLEAKSPSKLMIKLAGYIADGLVIGFHKNSSAANAAGVFGTEVVTKLNSSLSNVASIVENMGEFNPTITPIVDMTHIERSAAQMTALMSSPKFDASVSFGQAASLAVATREQFESEKEPEALSTEIRDIKFEQHNYSPKALSTSDIYRNTKSQVARAKEELKTL